MSATSQKIDLAAIATATRDECVAILAAVAARLAEFGAPAPVATGKLLTPKELACELAVSLDTIYTWARQGRIRPAIRNGRRSLYDLQAVRQALIV